MEGKQLYEFVNSNFQFPTPCAFCSLIEEGKLRSGTNYMSSPMNFGSIERCIFIALFKQQPSIDLYSQWKILINQNDPIENRANIPIMAML